MTCWRVVKMTTELKLLYEHIFDIEDYLLSLIREKDLIQNIEKEKLDFADLQISHELLAKHIEYTRDRLRKSRISALQSNETQVFEEEEEEVYSSSSKYTIEHLIEDENGNLREPVESDFYIHKHPGVKRAFECFHRWRKYRMRSEEAETYE